MFLPVLESARRTRRPASRSLRPESSSARAGRRSPRLPGLRDAALQQWLQSGAGFAICGRSCSGAGRAQDHAGAGAGCRGGIATSVAVSQARSAIITSTWAGLRRAHVALHEGEARQAGGASRGAARARPGRQAMTPVTGRRGRACVEGNVHGKRQGSPCRSRSPARAAASAGSGRPFASAGRGSDELVDCFPLARHRRDQYAPLSVGDAEFGAEGPRQVDEAVLLAVAPRGRARRLRDLAHAQYGAPSCSSQAGCPGVVSRWRARSPAATGRGLRQGPAPAAGSRSRRASRRWTKFRPSSPCSARRRADMPRRSGGRPPPAGREQQLDEAAVGEVSPESSATKRAAGSGLTGAGEGEASAAIPGAGPAPDRPYYRAAAKPDRRCRRARRTRLPLGSARSGLAPIDPGAVRADEAQRRRRLEPAAEEVPAPFSCWRRAFCRCLLGVVISADRVDAVVVGPRCRCTRSPTTSPLASVIGRRTASTMRCASSSVASAAPWRMTAPNSEARQPRQQVAEADLARHARADLAQRGVARRHAEAVADVLHAVQAHQQQRERFAAAHRVVQLGEHHAVELAPVGDAGQRVDSRMARELAAWRCERSVDDSSAARRSKRIAFGGREVPRRRVEHRQCRRSRRRRRPTAPRRRARGRRARGAATAQVLDHQQLSGPPSSGPAPSNRPSGAQARCRRSPAAWAGRCTRPVGAQRDTGHRRLPPPAPPDARRRRGRPARRRRLEVCPARTATTTGSEQGGEPTAAAGCWTWHRSDSAEQASISAAFPRTKVPYRRRRPPTCPLPKPGLGPRSACCSGDEPGVLARSLVEPDLRPVGLDRAQFGRTHQHRRRVHRVVGHRGARWRRRSAAAPSGSSRVRCATW